MKVRALHHVNIVVNDVEKARTFYSEVLDLPIIDDRDETARPGGHFAAGDAQIHLTLGETLPTRGQHYALEIDDLESVIDELRRAGIEVTRSRRPGQVHIEDPSGNQIELRSPKAS